MWIILKWGLHKRSVTFLNLNGRFYFRRNRRVVKAISSELLVVLVLLKTVGLRFQWGLRSEFERTFHSIESLRVPTQRY
ncbi:hypothetical protein BDZ94DRAFT_646870 [Collybia nuda]|uniref:Uncharacterized protein n=1 Tax=Collybia nuda TaxID=64659 RepID=A0A9P5Y8B0_9AGAR|nr:hypothetical protein BDZ94DRAFT_646870 [Collybia nuda]